MAVIRGGGDASVLQIRSFLGLNENPDGDTKIQNGEFSEMRNFCITRDKHLQIRPGQKTVLSLAELYETWAESNTPATESPVFCGAWEGMVGEQHRILAVYGGVIFHIAEDLSSGQAVGTCTQANCTIFGFSTKVYLLNGHEYKVWDGTGSFSDVEGYVPLVQTATNPAGQGTLLENVNRLTGKRRVRFSPNGTDKVFHLPQQDIDEVTEVEGTSVSYTADTSAGTLTFASAPAAGTNTVTVTYRKGDGARSEVTGMKFSEIFNGKTDSRVFLYGDGTNKTIYSGLDNDGKPTAEYFPDLYEIAVGEANTPITGLVRHYSRLMVYKTSSAWSIQYSTVTLESSLETPAFYVVPVNRLLGNEAPGQVKLLENNPLTLDGSSIYQWKATTTSGYITDSQTNANRVSDRVHTTVRGFDPAQTVTFNHKDQYEFWFLCGTNALILNYAADAWYFYTDVPFRALLDLSGQLYGFTEGGGMVHISRSYRNDNGTAIDAYAATGSMDFGRDFQLKYSAMIFVALLPETNARISVTAQSNRRSDYQDKVVAMNLSSFTHVDFAHWSFRTNRTPQVKREKIKVKKATFYRLIFKSLSASATATVLETDIQFRYAGNVK